MTPTGPREARRAGPATSVCVLRLRNGCGSPLERYLAPDEVARARRFRRPGDRDRFVAGRALVRLALGRALEVAPEEVELVRGPNGKPVVRRAPGTAGPFFNVAHSGALVVLALDAGARVGIDVDAVGARPGLAEVARRVCSEAELASLEALTEREASAAVARVWTRKEAVAKASGQGLSAPFDRIAVPLDAPAAPGAVLLGTVAAVDEWSLWSVSVPAGYVAALAVEGAPGEVAVAEVDEAWLEAELSAGAAA